MTQLRTLGVWLTAVMTMAAGFPQYVCACPGRPATTLPDSSAQSCPCGGSCCTGAAGAKCCDKDRIPTKPLPTPESGQTVCKKVPAAPHAQISSAAERVSGPGESLIWTAITRD